MNLNKFINIVRGLSLTSTERITALFYELEHIRKNNIDGDLVECGVYRGGNILGMMEYCYHFDINKRIWLYDTFSGMTDPTNLDVDIQNNQASQILSDVKCYSSLQEVQSNLQHSKYNRDLVSYVIGDVCESLKDPNNIPNSISLLRLDTDWYESTLCELKALYSKVSINGSVIIDDYGHWLGCKRAVDEFFNNSQKLNKIDYTGVFFRKTE